GGGGAGTVSTGNFSISLGGSLALTPWAAAPAKLNSTFYSDDGFGDPEAGLGSQYWTVRQVLSYLKARPGMYITHIIMEYCDRGSLLAAIKRGVFRTDHSWQDGEGFLGATSLGGGCAGGVGGGGALWASSNMIGRTVAAPPPRPPAHGPVGDSSSFPWASGSRRVALRALLRTARDVAQGMCHLHANGIIHGDLKPGNVLLRGCRSDRRGFVAVVSDFGLSKVTRGEKPLDLNHWSTVTVMGPEVIMGTWLKASDVFSFGILLWQLVTGEIKPYGTCTVPQILVGVSQGTLKPEWPASAHPPLVRLGRACLATSPEKRPSFGAIVKMLTKIEKDVRGQVRQYPADQRKPASAASASASAVAAAAAAAAAAHGGLSHRRRQQPTSSPAGGGTTAGTLAAASASAGEVAI
ncbi:hypothetical protein VaNZ11_016532, partial [Volvox africanus]